MTSTRFYLTASVALLLCVAMVALFPSAAAKAQALFGVVTSDPTVGNDEAQYAATDSMFVYTVGYDSNGGNEWHIEKRKKTTGALVSTFGDGGIVTENPTAGSDEAIKVAVDGRYIYVVGYDSNGGNEWRIEKRNKATGALCSSASACIDGAFNGTGVITVDPTTGDDEANAVTIDDMNLYVGGYQTTGTDNEDWRMQKFNKTTGASVPHFGTQGVIVEPISAGDDVIASMTTSGPNLYLVGRDFLDGDGEWRIEERSKATGALIPTFGTNGAISQDNAIGYNDTAIDLAVDSSYLYIAGEARTVTDGAPNFSAYLEKRNLVTGALCDSATSCAEGAFGTGGIVMQNPSPSHDSFIALSVTPDSIYAGGETEYNSSSDQDWFMAKMNRITGALCASTSDCAAGAFGFGGTIIESISTGPGRTDYVRWVGADGTNVFFIGYDSAPAAGDAEWRIEKRSGSTGALL